MTNIISLIFRFINVGIIIGLGYYLFKTRIRGKIDEKITQKEMLLKGLEEQGYFLEGKAQELELQLEKQAIRMSVLRQKIDEWRMSVFLEKQKQQHEQQQHQTRIANQIAVKNNYLYDKTVKETIMPAAIDQARDSIQKKLHDSDAMNHYMRTIIEYLGQGK